MESFLRQDYAQRELIILNDTPGQEIRYTHPLVRVINHNERLLNLSAKVQFMIDAAQGEAFCRWDDDDISLPWRLSLSVSRLAETGRPEWRAANYWFDHENKLSEVFHAGNTHVTGIFTREALKLMPNGVYPPNFSGGEDQAFNREIEKHGLGAKGESVAQGEIYYLYRWGVSPSHLSGKTDSIGFGHHQHWKQIGQQKQEQGTFMLKPQWLKDHASRARLATHKSTTPGD